jgi:hypothetical protein
LLIAQSLVFSNHRTYLFKLCCGYKSSKGFPAVR